MKPGQWIEIFKCGNYGDKGNFTESDLDQIVANFSKEDKAPIVVGHPANNSPAWGWLSDVKRQGDVLLGRVGELHKDFAEALTEKKFKNRSVRIVGTEAGTKLLHLGFLGAVLPQVEGLKTPAQFDGAVHYCADYEFALPADKKGGGGQESKPSKTEEEKARAMEKDAKIKKLEKDLADERAARKSEQDASKKDALKNRKSAFSTFVESKLIATGKLAKDKKDEVVNFMMTLPVDANQADFSWGDGDDQKGSSAQWFMDFASQLPVPDFVGDLPGDKKDFSRQAGSGELVDLSHQV